MKRIPLTQNAFAIVDDSDYESLAVHRWYLQKGKHTCYAVRYAGGKKIYMHREILQAPPGCWCDHVNGDGLDNRRSNLRLCTPAQNRYNSRPHRIATSRYKGVSWDCHAKKWKAQIEMNGRDHYIGLFDYELDAAIAYDDRAVELFGEFAWLNGHHRPEVTRWLAEMRLFGN